MRRLLLMVAMSAALVSGDAKQDVIDLFATMAAA
jgi:hypothetical protein